MEFGEKADELCLKTPLDNGSESDDSGDEREGGGETNNQEEIGDMIIVLNKVSSEQSPITVATVEPLYLGGGGALLNKIHGR